MAEVLRSSGATASVLRAVPAAGAGRSSGAPRGEASRRSESGADTRVELSDAARTLDGQRRILGVLLAGAERAVAPASTDPQDDAARSEYLSSIDAPADLSPEATAERILGGVTGYIFGAFRRSRGELVGSDLDAFEADVRAGFARGLGAAADIIEALGRLTPTQDHDIDAIRAAFDAGFTRFIDAERDGLREASAPRA